MELKNKCQWVFLIRLYNHIVKNKNNQKQTVDDNEYLVVIKGTAGPQAVQGELETHDVTFID